MSVILPTAADSRYLQGNFAPVTEELTTTDLTVSGHLPEHLDGDTVGPCDFRCAAFISAAAAVRDPVWAKS